MVLYADVLFAINFSMDFLAIFLTSIFMHFKIHKLRIILSSLIGATYGVVQIFFNLNLFFTTVVCVGFAVIMILVAFPEIMPKKAGIAVAMYIFLSTALSGMMSLLYALFNKLLASFIANYSYEGAYSGARIFIIIGLTAIASIVFGRILTSKKEIKSAELFVEYKHQSFKMTGLCDSGNLLKEPFSGKCVILVGEESQLGKEILAAEELTKKYIPYKDINGEGLLKGIVPGKIKINGNLTDAVIATVKNKDFNGYDALIPGVLA